MSDDHLTDDQILAVAEQSDDVSEQQRGHLEHCAACRDRRALMRAFLNGIGDVILESRPGCPTPEELAAIPPGGEADNSHVQTCPLCQEELQLHRDLAQDHAIGFTIGSNPAALIGGEMPSVFRAAGASLRLFLTPGAESQATVSGAFVSISVVASVVVVTVESEPDVDLVLLLTDEGVEKRIRLAQGELRMPLSSWLWAAVEPTQAEEKR